MTTTKNGHNRILDMISIQLKLPEAKQIPQFIGNVVNENVITMVEYSKKGDTTKKRKLVYLPIPCFKHLGKVVSVYADRI